MKKSLVQIAGLCLLAGAVFLVLWFVPAKNTITLKKDGFHPRTLTIHAGETVTFQNERGKYFWPASDFHPSHTLFPAFDAKKPIAPNDSYQFTFDTPGTYPFHDHLAAYFFGVVRVADSDGNVPDNCNEKGGDVLCWQNQLFLTLAEKGVDATYDLIAKLFSSEPTFASACHGLTHAMGLASYQFFAQNPDFIYSPKAVACASGFYHGFMEGFLGATGDVEGAARLCDKIGTTLGKESPAARLQCYHGIGHGAVETTVASSGSFGAEDAFVESALRLCERASIGTEERYRCVSGVYNGIANFYINGAYGLSVKKENPLALCARQEEQYKEACYGNMNSVAFWAAKNSFIPAADYVLSLPDAPYRGKAIEYLAGLYALYHIADASFEVIVAECHELPGEYHTSCTNGFVNGLLEHGSPGIEYKQALQFCREQSLSDTERDSCFSAVLDGQGNWFSKDKLNSICASVIESEKTYCPK